jgi:hypothetical protein
LTGGFAGLIVNTGKTLLMQLKHLRGGALVEPSHYLFTVAILFCFACNFYYLNNNISRYSQLQVMPIHNSCVIFGTLITGGIIQNEF